MQLIFVVKLVCCLIVMVVKTSSHARQLATTYNTFKIIVTFAFNLNTVIGFMDMVDIRGLRPKQLSLLRLVSYLFSYFYFSILCICPVCGNFSDWIKVVFSVTRPNLLALLTLITVNINGVYCSERVPFLMFTGKRVTGIRSDLYKVTGNTKHR